MSLRLFFAMIVSVLVTRSVTTQTTSSTKEPCPASLGFCGCSPGIPGIPGNPGSTGSTGAQGQMGVQGPKGEIGLHGVKGQKGESGIKGDQGRPGKMGNHGNWKQCAWSNLNKEIDTGLIVECAFNKLEVGTTLRVVWNGALRTTGKDGICKRWFFTFNGSECGAPLSIDGVVYVKTGKTTQNPHRVRHIEGYCTNIGKGSVQIGFNVGNCAGGYGDSDAYTGWNSVSRIIVEEVPPPQS